MIELLILSIVNAFIIIGVYESTQVEVSRKREWVGDCTDGHYKYYDVLKNKMFFWWIRYYGDKALGPFWSKPFYACCVCMSSVHSTYVYWGYQYLYDTIILRDLWVYPGYILLVAGVTTAIVNKIY